MLEKEIRIKHFHHTLLFPNSMYLLLLPDLGDYQKTEIPIFLQFTHLTFPYYTKAFNT